MVILQHMKTFIEKSINLSYKIESKYLRGADIFMRLSRMFSYTYSTSLEIKSFIEQHFKQYIFKGLSKV